MSIPSVDLGDFLSGDQEMKNQFVQQTGRAYEEIGFVAIKNHGISEEWIANRAEQHEDINLITLLIGAPADRLDILSKQGERVPVTSLPAQVVVKAGDMLQRFTNNKLYSTTRRVVNPKRDFWHTSHFSIPFFLHPKTPMSLRYPDTCIDGQHPK